MGREDDGLLVWAAQGRVDAEPGPRVRARREGDAVVVASPGLSGRDRLAVAGSAGDAVGLVGRVPAEVGPSYRPFGEAALMAEVVRRTPGLIGVAKAVSGFVADELVARYGRAALMVDADNLPAVAAYERLGMTKRLLGAAYRSESRARPGDGSAAVRG